MFESSMQFLGDVGLAAERAGKKAGNLHRLASAGFRVPGGFVLFPGDEPDREALTKAIDRIGGFPVAVRSSGVLEDLAGASFAGQYETYLHVATIDDLVARIEQCRDSAKAPRVLAYLDKHGLDPKAAGLAVLVQRMIEPRMAGVAFSVHPLTGREEHGLIEACQGVGERLVSGQVAPSRFTIELRTGAIREQRIEEADATLSEGLAREFAGLLLDIQAHFGRPQDVEWAVDEHDTLWILQARPITTVAWRSDLGDLSSSNMREGGIAARVCFPIVQSLIGGVAARSLHEYLSSVHLAEPRAPEQWMHWVYGRPYYSVGTLKRAMAKLPGFDEEGFDRGMGIKKSYGSAGPARTPFTVNTVANALPTVFEVFRWYERNLRMLDGHRERYMLRERSFIERIAQFNQASDQRFAWELKSVIRDLFEWNERVYLITGYTNHSAQREFHELIDSLDRSDGEKTNALRLMGGLAGIFHLEVNRELAALAQIAKQHGFESERWERSLATFLEKNGMHSDTELDLTVARWIETPERVRSLVEAMIASDTAIADGSDRAATQLREFEDERARVRRRIRSTILRRARYGLLFEQRLDRMRLFLKRKEELRELSTRTYYVVRRYVLEAGRRMDLAGVIDDPLDVYYLTVDELLAHFAGAMSSSDVLETVRYRGRLYQGFRDFDPPHELGHGVVVEELAPASGNVLVGVGCSPGRAEGPARVLRSVSELGQLRDGDILVTRFTDPGWTPALAMVRGIVTEVGGVLSHAAVIGREYGIPTALNVKGATERIRSGQRIRVDGATGRVELLEEGAS